MRRALGLCSYYASAVQDFLQSVSWLWFIPEPDRSGGLAALRAVSESDSIDREAASLALMNIFTCYESDYREAEVIARELHTEFPGNTLIHFELLRILSVTQGNVTSSSRRNASRLTREQRGGIAAGC
jgi:hypothetical protein